MTSDEPFSTILLAPRLPYRRKLAHVPRRDQPGCDAGDGQLSEGEMNSYFQLGRGAAANVTGPSAFDGQAAGYYSGGSFVDPLSDQSRSIRSTFSCPARAAAAAGSICSGGSFSFINTDEIVATLKATANNAIGFAFQLAIDSISAQIGGVMKDMSHKIQQMNEFNMNSCQFAQEAVGSIWPKMDGASQTICQNLGRSSGLFSDEAKGAA